MKVVKRGDRGTEDVQFDKINNRIKALSSGLKIDPIRVSQKTIESLFDGISTEELDKISANIADSMKIEHPDYGILAGRIVISNLHKTTPDKFSTAMKIIGRSLKVKSEKHFRFIRRHAAEIDSMIIHENDYQYDKFGFTSLEHGYLVKIKTPVLVNDKRVFVERIVDRPQYILMRVAVALYAFYDPPNALNNIKECYEALSAMYFTHATPTLFNACFGGQLDSCFLLGTGDSIEEIMRTLSNASFISKWSGGESIWMHCIRAQNSYINGTNGISSGLPKQIKLYNDAARCWDQGGKRKGAFAIYIEPWHGDIMSFLRLGLSATSEEERCEDLFFALWISDLFAKRVIENADWSLFSEDTAPGLSDVYDGMPICKKCGFCQNRNYIKFQHIMKKLDGADNVNANNTNNVNNDDDDVNANDADSNDDVPPQTRAPINDGVEDEALFARVVREASACNHEFESRNVFTELYERYEREGRALRVIKARDVHDAIMHLQREKGKPYMLGKDHINRRSNQQNIGTIKSSNLCCEIVEWSSEYSYATCTLASINLKKFLIVSNNPGIKYEFDHIKLHKIVRLITRNLNIVVDINNYPVDECRHNAVRFRPIGIGIQALADLFCIMRIPFLSQEAARLDVEITETIAHAAYTESVALAKQFGPYSEFAGSPASRGILSFDMWQEDINTRKVDIFADTGLTSITSGRYDWPAMRADIMKYGLRNSLLLAFMPTVTTSQIMGNNESFEPFPCGIYVKGALSSNKALMSNHYMIRHLIELGLWDLHIKDRVESNGGSIQKIEEIPPAVKEIYKTVYELSQKKIMQRAALRGAFVDQALSLNIHLPEASNKALRSIFITGHEFGLKNISYYIRTLPVTGPLNNNLAAIKADSAEEAEVCRRVNGEVNCTSCSS